MTGSTDNGYIAARIYGMRSRLLNTAEYEKLENAADTASLITLLRGTEGYRDLLEAHLLLEEPLTAVDSAINDKLSRRMKRILSFCGGSYEQAFRVLSLRWEVSNIHLAVRTVIEDTEFPINFIPLGHLDRDELIHISSLSNLNEVLTYLESTLNPFTRALHTIINANIPTTNLNAIDGIFNQFYQNLITRGLAKITDGQIAASLTRMIKEEREFQNTTYILNLIGKLKRGTLPSTVDLKGVIFPGKAQIQPEEVETLVRNKDITGFREILARTSYRDTFATSAVDTVTTAGIQPLIEEIERQFYLKQTRKRFKGSAFNLALGYYWQMSVEARNLRILNHGIESFSREEIKRRLLRA